MSLMDAHPMYSENIYTHFIYAFLQTHGVYGEYSAVAMLSQVKQRNVVQSSLVAALNALIPKIRSTPNLLFTCKLN